MRTIRHAEGFTLVEVMVSATVLSLGIMGMAAMQGVSITKGVDANDLTVVTNIAADMMERVQNNRRWAWAYNNLQTVGAGNCGPGGVPAPAPAPPFPAQTPGPLVTSRVQGDCAQWRALVLSSNLPNIQGTVQVIPFGLVSPNSSATQVQVQVQWNDRGPTQRLRTVRFQSVMVPE
jgi:type IV pilus assembly protein PilV